MEIMETNLKSFNSGDSLNFYFDIKGASNLEYNIKLILTNSQNPKKEFTLVADSNLLNRFNFILSFSNNNIIANDYQSHLVITKNDNTERETLTYRTITVNQSVLNTNNTNLSHAEKVLDAIEATIERRATSDHLSYSIDGKSITKMPIESLLKWRDIYRLEVEKIKNKNNNFKNTNKINVYWVGNNYR